MQGNEIAISGKFDPNQGIYLFIYNIKKFQLNILNQSKKYYYYYS